jgi:thioesterase domain-containing protein
MATNYIESIMEIQSHGPYYLGGWSFGGIVAYEMAQQLLRAGEKIAFLGLIESYTPMLVNILESEYSEKYGLDGGDQEVVMLESFARDLLGIDTFTEFISQSELSREPDKLFAWIRDKAMERELFPSDPDHLHRLFDVFRANIMAMNSYQAKPYKGRITLFRADGDVGSKSIGDSARGWEDLASGGLTIKNIQGNHYTILRQPYVSALVHHLTESEFCG